MATAGRADRTGFLYSSSAEMAACKAAQDDSALLKPPTRTSKSSGSRSSGASPLFEEPEQSFAWSPKLDTTTEATDHLGRTALHQLADAGDIASLQQLLLTDSSQLGATDNQGNTALLLALQKCEETWAGHRDCAEALIKAKDSKGSLDTVNDQGESALHLTLIRNQPELTATLVQAGANRGVRGVNGNTPLHVALYLENSAPFILSLLTAANLRAANDEGNTPMHTAAQTAKVRLLRRKVRLFASRFKEGFKLDITCVNKTGKTALHEALFAEKTEEIGPVIESVKALIKMDRKLLDIPDTEGNFPLHLALMKSSLSCLVPNLTTPEAKKAVNSKGETPFLLALKNKATKWIGYVSTPAVRTTPDYRGNTPLHIAVVNGLIPWIRPLVTEQTISAPNKAGNTPVHLANLHGHPKAVTILTGLGADLQARNKKSQTPHDLALEYLEKKSEQLKLALSEAQDRNAAPKPPLSAGECPF